MPIELVMKRQSIGDTRPSSSKSELGYFILLHISIYFVILKVVFHFSDPGTRFGKYLNFHTMNFMQALREKDMSPERVENIWLEDYYSCPFNQLRLVQVADIVGVRYEMDFINFLLANSPVLERMTVRPAFNDIRWELLKELERFRRASVRVEIIFSDHN